MVPEKSYKLFNINLSRIHIVHVYSCERPKFTNKIKFCLVRGTPGVVRLFPPLCCFYNWPLSLSDAENAFDWGHQRSIIRENGMLLV